MQTRTYTFKQLQRLGLTMPDILALRSVGYAERVRKPHERAALSYRVRTGDSRALKEMAAAAHAMLRLRSA